MKQNQLFNSLIIVLTIHVFSVHTKLLYYLNPEVTEKHLFSYMDMDEAAILAMIFALSYSIATAFVIYLTKKRWMVMTYAGADGIAVLLYYFTKIPVEVSAFYFALYTFFLIASTTLIKDSETSETKISKLKKSGMTQKDIAMELGVSESSVSRSLAKKDSK